MVLLSSFWFEGGGAATAVGEVAAVEARAGVEVAARVVGCVESRGAVGTRPNPSIVFLKSCPTGPGAARAGVAGAGALAGADGRGAGGAGGGRGGAGRGGAGRGGAGRGGAGRGGAGRGGAGRGGAGRGGAGRGGAGRGGAGRGGLEEGGWKRGLEEGGWKRGAGRGGLEEGGWKRGAGRGGWKRGAGRGGWKRGGWKRGAGRAGGGRAAAGCITGVAGETCILVAAGSNVPGAGVCELTEANTAPHCPQNLPCSGSRWPHCVQECELIDELGLSVWESCRRGSYPTKYVAEYVCRMHSENLAKSSRQSPKDVIVHGPTRLPVRSRGPEELHVRWGKR